MAQFEPAFARLMKDEGVSLTNDPSDRGGLTFCGISRKFHPGWEGWKHVDHGNTPSMDMVRTFYKENFWNLIHGDDMIHQRVAEVVFSQYVNMGATGVKMMQTTVGVIADGKVWTKTLNALNAMDEDMFLMRYALANIARYHAIGMKDKTQRKFWAGWFKRGLSICL